VLDLFSGTGSLSLEFASRGAKSVTSVDASYHCVRFLKETAQKLKLGVIRPFKADVFKFVKQEKNKFDVIFADPPFDHPKLSTLPGLIAERSLLRDEESLFIMEHPTSMQFDHLSQLSDKRQYGYSSFSFFRMTQAIH
jgi:16S rRNA (guanine(966)-N(2))-methyltransferase RsmD